MTYLIIALTAIVSYLIGSVNFSILLSKMLSGKDIRESGSGNAGATNMLRTYGKKMGIITLLLDVLKGIVVILLSRLVKNIAGTDEIYPVISYIAGVCVILGHNFPLYFGFKGGKGVATSLGVVLMLDWTYCGCCCNSGYGSNKVCIARFNLGRCNVHSYRNR